MSKKSNNYNRNKGERGRANDVSAQSNDRNSVSRTSTQPRSKRGKSEASLPNHSGSMRASYILASNDQLLRDTGSLSFSYATGHKYRINPEESTNPVDFTVPGIMALRFTPTIGVEPGNVTSSSVNICAKALYAKMWAKRTGASTAYDAADVMLYAIGLANIAMFHTFLIRAYGVARSYSVTNRYKPLALLKAMCLDPEDVVNHLPRFRTIINRLASALSSFAIPQNIPILQTWSELVRDVYVDGDTDKSQMYLYVPDSFYVIEELNDTGTGLVRNQYWKSTPYTVDDIESLVQTWVNTLLSSQDFAAITGDLIRTFDGLTPIQLPFISEEYVQEPVYDPVVLVQIANTTMVGSVGDIQQDALGTISQEVINEKSGVVTSNHYQSEVILNFPTGEVTPEMVFLATRGTAIQNWAAMDADGSNPVFTGSYAVSGIAIMTDPNGTIHTLTNNGPAFSADGALTVPAMGRALMAILKLSNFAFHPYIPILQLGNTDDPVHKLIYYGNINNYTIMDYKELSEINRVYMNAQFGLPYNV